MNIFKRMSRTLAEAGPTLRVTLLFALESATCLITGTGIAAAMSREPTMMTSESLTETIVF